MTLAVNIAQSGSSNVTFRNKIINGNMVIDQRNAGAAVTVNSTGQAYPVDRFFGTGQSSDGVFTLQQSSTVPAGFVNSIIATVTTADASIGATQNYLLRQRVEGYNIADLNWGTANAVTVTFSFWVRSSLTGTFGGTLHNGNGDRFYPYSYTISAANTWEQKTITIAGDTTGTWEKTNGIGLNVIWSLGTGSTLLAPTSAWTATTYTGFTGQTNLIATNGATWQVTGVQLEAGTTASPFEYRQYGTELALCQRYCFQMNTGDSGSNNVKFALGTNASTTQSWTVVHFPVQLRTYPTLTVTSTASNYGVFQGSDIACSAVPFINSNSSPNVGQVIFTVASGLTANGCSMGQTNSNNTAYLRFNAEL